MIGNGDLNGITIAGGMYIKPGDSYSISVTDLLYNKLTGFNKGKESNVIVDGSAGTFTVEIDGTYKFAGIASVAPSAGMFLKFGVYINNIFQEKIEACLDFKNSQDTNTFAGTGFLDLKAGDVVDIRGKSDTQPVTLGICNMNIEIHRIGH